MELLDLIKQNNLSNLLLDGNFGLEIENMRTDAEGNIALTSHPSVFGDKATNPFITTDFAEAQVEMITPVLKSTSETLEFAAVLHDMVSLMLKDEYLWPYSLPPILPKDDSLIKPANFANNPEISKYREYLVKKYGKRKQLLSGIHFNFSFSHELMEHLYNATDKKLSYREFNDKVYLKVAREYLKYCWLVIYLFGANSVAHESYISCCKRSLEKITNDTYDFHGASSFRNGESGYRNINHFYVSYNSLPDYVRDIQKAIHDGEIIEAKEYYSQIRLKGHSKSGVLEDLTKNGINYIEIRTPDLNPLTKLGITKEQMDFIHLMLVYCLLAPDFCMCDDDYQIANMNQLLAADANRNEPILLHFTTDTKKPLQSWGQEVMQNMYETFQSLGISEDKLSILRTFKTQLDLHQPSIASTLVTGVRQEGYAEFFMQRAKQYLVQAKEMYPSFNPQSLKNMPTKYATDIIQTLSLD